ncbi:zinc finger Y-chromosomal protein 1-like [Anoplophora glabripennis]|uniref:zinc finger Y-chromosomal protein 1-like n=1 Tax=Anoplophora glabripennis TaxID=217634 RepID=UPI000873580D|nr:zinc finger Y-chromosomal protein 1-like [Anoplophora glabripennis]
MDQFGKRENLNQAQSPVTNNCNKPTYLTTYQQFLSSQIQPYEQVQGTTETKGQRLNERIVLLEEIAIQKPHIPFLESKQVEPVNDMPVSKCNNSKQKTAETDDNLSPKTTVQRTLRRNINHNQKRISQGTPTGDASGITPNEPPTDVEDESIKAYECKICSFETIYDGIFREHMLTHKKRETFHKCPKCNFKMKCKAGVKKHMVTEGSGTVYCGLYSYSNECKGNLASHLKVHRKDRNRRLAS